MTLTTTLRALRVHNACQPRYDHLVASFGGSRPGDDEQITLLRILGSNGLEDAIWALRAASPYDERRRVTVGFACDCADRVLPIFERRYPDDRRPRDCIETTRRYMRGEATREELRADAARASDAAEAAAWAADASDAAEIEWQTERLRAYLAGEVEL